MDKMKMHEISAYLIPGALVILGFLLFFPSGVTALFSHNISIGDFGIFAILAYSMGHIIQIFGSYIEKGIIKIRDDFQSKKNFTNLLYKDQQELIIAELKKQRVMTADCINLPDREWQKIYRLIHLTVINNSKSERIDIIKSHSKLCRGLGTGLLLLLLSYIGMGKFKISEWFMVLIVVIAIMGLFNRMRGFDKRDAQETYLQFIKDN